MNDIALRLQHMVGRRQRAELTWKIFLSAALVFALEVPLPPIPPRMAIPLMVFSVLMTIRSFYIARRMPFREALLLAQLHDEKLSLSLLCSHLEIEINVAEAILRTLERRGMLQVDSEALADDNELIYHVKGLMR